MNPFDQKPIVMNDCLMDWAGMYPLPYDKRTVDPYTRTRVILMSGTEFENVWYTHQLSRHQPDQEVRRQVALIRRSEQQQQKAVAMLKPLDETVLEHTIGYEQLAVDLTAALAKREREEIVRNALNFALLEDFDHLYRYAQLLDMDQGVKAEDLVGRYTEVMPARPTIAHHRYPFDSIKPHIDCKQASLETKLCVGIITAAEQQTMNFYMNVCNSYKTDRGRKLYEEIGMIEEQHVTEYGSLMDVNASWLEGLLMHQYTECYLYWSCMETESDPRIKQFWAMLYEQEVAHLHLAKALLNRYEGKDHQQVVGTGDFPAPLKLESNIDHVRRVLADTVQLTGVRESYGDIRDLKPDYDFFLYQNRVNHDLGQVASHTVVKDYIGQSGQDYRFETATNPIEALRDRRADNTDVGRVPMRAGAEQPVLP